MTKDEAINELIRIRQVQNTGSEAHEALGMAIDALSQPSPPEGLEEAAWQYAEQEIKTWGSNEPNERKEIHDDFIAGAKWDRTKMMEKAVEGRVFMSFAPGRNQMVMADVDLPTNTKVKIIVIPE